MEYEKKCLINRKDYDTIIQECTIIETIYQKNYYFETKDNYFKNNDSAFRIRHKNNSFVMTLKIATENGNVEYNSKIEKEDFNNIINNKKIPFIDNNYLDTNKKIFSTIIIRTIRKKINFNDHIIEIDENYFNDIKDYEIEIESTSLSLAKKVLGEFLKKFDIKFKKSYPKIKRYHQYN